MNKKLGYFFTFAYSYLSVAAIAQNSAIFQTPVTSAISANVPCDTLKNYAGTDYTLYRISDLDHLNTGYLSGTNSYKDRAKAEKYTVNLPYRELVAVRLLFLVAKTTNADNLLTINVWLSEGGLPGKVLSSAKIKIADIKVNEFTTVTLPSVLETKNTLFIGFDIPKNAGDTIAVATCKSGDGMDDTGWEQTSDGSWNTYASANMDLQPNNIIYPIFCDRQADLQELELERNIKIYPNPAKEKVNVTINLKDPQGIKIDTYSLLGKLVNSTYKTNCSNETFDLDMSAFTAGVYMILISTDKERITKYILLAN